GRRRAASSSSSGSRDDELEPAAAPPPATGSSSNSDSSEREGEPEEGEGDPGSVAACSEGAKAPAAEGSLSLEEPAGSPSRRAATGQGPRLAGAGPAQSGKGLLSFGSEEEREGDEELFKIKKPSFNEVIFRIQKKESQLPAQTETEESKKICQLQPTTGNTKGSHAEEEEEEGESYSSLSEDYNSSDSENESRSLHQRKHLSPGNIPRAACIEAARRKRHLARTQAEYLPLDVSDSHQISQRRESSDLDSEDESDTKNVSFVPKVRTLRQRMTEHMGEFVPFLPVVV
ncbi:GCFC2 factor, partial [Galbula dea]|nr:GCFC2 factor [Galbula dea]